MKDVKRRLMVKHVVRRSSHVLTWVGHPILIAGNVIIQGLQHHPHGEGEHSRQEPIEDEVEEQDET